MSRTKRVDMLWPPSFEAAIFDFDDTLALTHDLWRRVDVTFLSSRGIQYTPDLAQTLSTLGFEGGAQYCISRYGLKDTPEEICEEWRSMGRAFYASDVNLRPGAERYIRALRSRGILVGLATTNERDVLEAIGRRIDFDGLFDAIACATDVSCGKDQPDIYLEAARRMGIDPNAAGGARSCMVYEDLLMGVTTAKRAGFRTCAVLSDNPNQNPLEMERAADCLISDWRDIPIL
ncbi:MAG: HAD family hydrolase [Tractidigestivibacter sp.]|jgi:HAD superfamily hydrolase (TIGR01509 family)|uniref:HAD family hydrolase n=1 Tax=Tractidigestivibacter sp. TaxID=2847320 RepID=UPI003D8F82E1